MTLREEYRKAKNTTVTIRKYPKSYYPKLTDEDYRIGYIERYFAKPQVNIKAAIIEISKDEYESLTGIFPTAASLHYKAIKLRWVIKGTLGDVQRSNSSTLVFQEKNMPGISLYLGNLLQFWQG
jgi:N-formylglutamate amidohydrolase